MATATTTTVEVAKIVKVEQKQVTLVLSEDEAHALLALTGACASLPTGDSPTSDTYDALTLALGGTTYWTASKFAVGTRDGGYLGNIYLHPNA